MTLKNKKRNGARNDRNKEPKEPLLRSDTKKSIWAVIFLATSTILLLASFQSAGLVGSFLYRFFDNLFGWGYYFLPLTFLIMAGVFLTSEHEHRRIHKIVFIGAVIFVLAGLGLLDLVFENKAGLVGRFVGSLEIFFGYAVSLIIAVSAIVISLLITLNLPIKIKRKNVEGEEKTDGYSPVEEIKIADGTFSPIKDAKEIKKESAAATESKEAVTTVKETPVETKIFVKALKPQIAGNYVVPPLDLLRTSSEKPVAGDLRANANIIKRTLEGFGIPVEMGEISIGPKVTRYTLKPAEGIKISRITTLSQDLALALAAHPIRIEAPIPGKSLVGIEVPNKASALVRLGSLMTYPEFASSGLLSFVLGRDVSGEPIFADIEKMPHLLIGGSTGSGKSILLHSLLISLLYKNSPQTLGLILIDPKRVELSIYGKIPHLLTPVVTEAKKTAGVFKWLISEMERRYELFLGAGARDINSYNKKESAAALSYILVVIDELADLMAIYGREIESSVVRLAQMARATGIHLAVSTQRPSTEVVTGLIKANIRSRIALQLPSQIDSRTILDAAGAEKLLGGGDLLFISSEFSKPKRIQGAYLSEEEIGKVVKFIEENNKKDDGGEEIRFENGPAQNGYGSFDEEDGDELLEEALRAVAEAKKASASLLQRRLRIGYARAARLLDIMEAKQLIGPGEGAKPREVYLEKINESHNV